MNRALDVACPPQPAALALHEHRFRAMNTDVAAWLWSDDPGAAGHLAEVETFFGTVEAELSRFRPTSGLSRLNAHAGSGPQRVSRLLLTVLQEALAASEATGGLFDPTVLAALTAAGYDRSFEQVTDRPAAPALAASAANVQAWRQIRVDPTAGTVTRPAGLGIDLGGIAKGWTVDRAAERLAAYGPALVDAGGDIRASAPPGDQPWPIGVQDPFNPAADVVLLALAEGAVATSSVGGRRWRRGGQTMHHLIDPATGLPGRSDVHTATVLAPTAQQAEVAAKVALLLGRRAGTKRLAAAGLAGLLIGHDGETTMVGALPMVLL